MFVILNTFRTKDLICIDVRDINYFVPDTVVSPIVDEQHQMTVIYSYSKPDSPWYVRQTMGEVYEMCQKAKRSEL